MGKPPPSNQPVDPPPLPHLRPVHSPQLFDDSPGGGSSCGPTPLAIPPPPSPVFGDSFPPPPLTPVPHWQQRRRVPLPLRPSPATPAAPALSFDDPSDLDTPSHPRLTSGDTSPVCCAQLPPPTPTTEDNNDDDDLFADPVEAPRFAPPPPPPPP
eukprot:Sspe_Gene.3444::Locus_1142_Transcript_2_2_Confidence_0.667_Length_519::g.3444::m.3444